MWLCQSYIQVFEILLHVIPSLTGSSAVITSESGGNLRVCGFGSGGRYAKSVRL